MKIVFNLHYIFTVLFYDTWYTFYKCCKCTSFLFTMYTLFLYDVNFIVNDIIIHTHIKFTTFRQGHLRLSLEKMWFKLLALDDRI